MPKTILILGGTFEAYSFAQMRANDQPDWRIITSLAGRTNTPKKPVGETRIGGFGGAEGLASYLTQESVDLLVDGTHPFAVQISKNAQEAAKLANVELKIITREPWKKQAGDQWIDANNLEHAVELLPQNACVFLALGSQHIQTFSKRNDCHFIIRMIDEPEGDLPLGNYELILSKPALDAQAEIALFMAHKITHLVARNSGGKASYAKIEAARNLGLPVIMISRPPSHKPG